MDFKIIDAHSHLWLRQDTEVEEGIIRTTRNGRSMFLGEERQMLPPFMIDGKNSAEVFLANMDYAQVSAAVVTQEFIDGLQNDYLLSVMNRYPDRFFVCGMCEFRKPGFFNQAKALIAKGFKAIKIPAHRLLLKSGRVRLNGEEMMLMFHYMEVHQVLLSIDMAEGEMQTGELREVIQECPNLKIAIGHFGMVTFPHWIDQLKLALYPHVMIESGGITWLFNDEFYPFKSAIKAIREAIDTVGINKLLWGSDYPRTITAITYRMSYDFVLKSDEFSIEEKALFLGLNAKTFYGFKNLITLPYIKNMSE
jgi:L-galactono-1,5-lactonase